MSEKNINITPYINQITVNNPDTGITINPDPELTTVIIQSEQTKVVEVQTPGPRGPQGIQGPVGPSGSVTSVGDSGSLQFAWDDETVSGSVDLVFNPLLRTLSLTGSFLISGSILPSADPVTGISSFSLGSATNAWKDIYVGNSTIYFVSESITHPLSIVTTDKGVVTLTIDGYPIALEEYVERLTTGSVTASVDVSGEIFTVRSASEDMFNVTNQGVATLRINSITPTAVEGGIFYSESGDFFFGF